VGTLSVVSRKNEAGNESGGPIFQKIPHIDPLRQRLRVIADKLGIDRHQKSGEAVQIQHALPWEGIAPREVEGAEIDVRPVAIPHEQGVSMGAADERATVIHQAQVIHEKGAPVRRARRTLDTERLPDRRGECVERFPQKQRLHREKGEVTAAGGTPPSAGDLPGEASHHPITELIDPSAEFTVCPKGVGHHTPPILSAMMSTKTANPFLREATGNLRASLTPRGAVRELATAMPIRAGRYTKPTLKGGSPAVFRPASTYPTVPARAMGNPMAAEVPIAR